MQTERRDRYPAEQEYQAPFSWKWVLPMYWPAWLGAALLGMFMILPWRVREGIAQVLGRYLLSHHKKRRGIVDLNLRWCFPTRSEPVRAEMAVKYFIHAARSLLDFGLLAFASARHIRRRIIVRGESHLLQASASNKRIIVLTCHSLALEFGALALTQSQKMVGLIKEARNPVFNYLLNRARTRFHGRLFTRDAGIRNIVRAIRAGYAFYYLPDEDLGETKQTTFVPFFGVPMATLTALGRMARACDAVVIPCYTYFDPRQGKYVADFSAPLGDFPTGDDLLDANRMNAELERMIRTDPEQYMWSFRMFQTRPDGEANPYKQL